MLLLFSGLALGLFSLNGAPHNWVDVGPASKRDTMQLRIALKQRNLAWLKERFEAVSDPDHEDYGKHLSVKDINNKLAPSEEMVRSVTRWLEKASVASSEWDRNNVDSIKLQTTVVKLKKLFPSLVFRTFKHSGSNSTTVAAQGTVKKLPKGIDLITGLAFFPTRGVKPSRKPLRAIDGGTVGPSSLYRLYNIDESVYPLSGSQGVVEFLDAGAYMPYYLTGGKGYKSFFQLAGIPGAVAPTIIGPFNSDEGELESSLDIEYLLAVGRGAHTVYWTEQRWMYEFGSDFFNKGTGITVVSISYSWSEVSQCLQPTGKPNPTCKELGVDSQQYVERTNTEFMKIGTSGVTLVVSSGDDGAPGNIDGAKCSPKLPLDSMFPAASPYVTTVGGTMIKKAIDGPVSTFTQPARIYKTKSVTQKICHDSKCTKNCKTTELPVGECLVSDDGKNSATVGCKLGMSIVETIYAGSKKCEGFAQKETIECNKCLVDTSGTYVYFSCGLDEDPKGLPAPVQTYRKKVAHKKSVTGKSVTQKICHDSKCTKNCKTTELPVGECLVSDDGKNSATVGCKLGMSIVETIYAGSKKCEGFAQKETIECNKCLVDTSGTYVYFSCGLDKKEDLKGLPAPVPVQTYRKEGVTGKSVTQKICHDSKCTKNCKTTELPVGECLVSDDGKNSATVGCKLGMSIVETIYAGSKKCEGFAQKETIECNKCLVDTSGTYVYFSCGLDKKEDLKGLPAFVPVEAKTVSQMICKDSKCKKDCKTTELPIGKCLVSDDGKNSAEVGCRLGASVVETIYAGSRKCEGFAQKEDIPCGKCLVDTAGTYVKFECGMDAKERLHAPQISELCLQNGGCITGSDEVVATYPDASITSGGGFSVYSSRPAYQEAVVSAYLKNEAATLPPADKYNAAGRGYPDVSAVAHNYAVWMAMWMPTDGTSASTPVVAGIFSVVNDQLVKKFHSKTNGTTSSSPKLGFANPLLYKLAGTNPDVFHDVTEGNNKCSSSCCGKNGFTATKGWDPASGLGSINTKELINAAILAREKK